MNEPKPVGQFMAGETEPFYEIVTTLMSPKGPLLILMTKAKFDKDERAWKGLGARDGKPLWVPVGIVCYVVTHANYHDYADALRSAARSFLGNWGQP
jgi:hypothetical protein